uniref:Uncharacterized protein n=1 Tax=Oryctolagus cuniculus TaxID=9986 RepID=A0A5F9DN65_RABIT
MTFPTKSSNQNFIVFLDEVQAPVVGDEGRDFLAILDQLDPHALPDGGVGLLGLNPYFLQHDALGVRGASEGVGLERRAQVGEGPHVCREREQCSAESGRQKQTSKPVQIKKSLGWKPWGGAQESVLHNAFQGILMS